MAGAGQEPSGPPTADSPCTRPELYTAALSIKPLLRKLLGVLRTAALANNFPPRRLTPSLRGRDRRS